MLISWSRGRSVQVQKCTFSLPKWVQHTHRAPHSPQECQISSECQWFRYKTILHLDEVEGACNWVNGFLALLALFGMTVWLGMYLDGILRVFVSDCNCACTCPYQYQRWVRLPPQRQSAVVLLLAPHPRPCPQASCARQQQWHSFASDWELAWKCVCACVCAYVCMYVCVCVRVCAHMQSWLLLFTRTSMLYDKWRDHHFQAYSFLYLPASMLYDK
jgi:hypothetical protein